VPTEQILYWVIAANLVGFVLMVWDKAKAEAGEWRVAESTLILWSLIGGSIGTLSASLIIRHKTRKQPIATMLRVIPVMQLLLGIAWLSGLIDPLIDTPLSQ
jgi:uncharacterized membrane protein YsdA (DUF1294 family)